MSRPSDEGRCDVCGEPMPPGEEMFRMHGYSGPCPKPPLPRQVNPDEVICPACTHQFRAIPESVQKELAAAYAELRKLRPGLTAIFDREVHDRAKVARET